MPPVTRQMLEARREKDCVGITLERKYFHVYGSFVKRSLRPSEWQLHPVTGGYCVPPFGNERILNEAAAMQFIAENTNIPVPKLFACIEDDGAVYIVSEYVDGKAMAVLPEEQRKVVEKELEGHLETLRGLKSDTWGGPSGIVRFPPLHLCSFPAISFRTCRKTDSQRQVIPPYRVMVKAYREQWRMKKRDSKDLVFCHNDLSTHNVIVDPDTLTIKAIIDWEYAGFFPQDFEGLFFRRPGPSVALEGESHDEEALLELMRNNEGS